MTNDLMGFPFINDRHCGICTSSSFFGIISACIQKCDQKFQMPSVQSLAIWPEALKQRINELIEKNGPG